MASRGLITLPWPVSSCPPAGPRQGCDVLWPVRRRCEAPSSGSKKRRAAPLQPLHLTAIAPPGRSLRTTGELYTDELQVPTSLNFSQSAKRCCAESACCKCTFQMFQMFQSMLQVFHTDIAKVDHGVAFVAMVCTRMLQASVFNVSSIFQTYVASVFIWMLHMFHTYVASVLSGCCVCLAIVSKCFSDVFASVSDACFKCFICLQTYVASVASGCFKSRSGVASPFLLSTASPSDVCCKCCIWMFQK